MGTIQSPLQSGYQDQNELIEGAERTNLGAHDEMPQPVSFVGEIETIGLLMKYEKIWESFREFTDVSVEYMESDLGIPFPFNYIVFVLSTILSLYFTTFLKSLICPKKPKDTHVFNNIDSVDLSKLMKMLEKIEKQGQGQTIDVRLSFFTANIRQKLNHFLIFRFNQIWEHSNMQQVIVVLQKWVN